VLKFLMFYYKGGLEDWVKEGGGGLFVCYIYIYIYLYIFIIFFLYY
jgi:hypothetical protein